jgi:hypothetical protein
MSKISGIKVVRERGRVDVEATLLVWEKRALERFVQERAEFQRDLEAHLSVASAWDDNFGEALLLFWEKFKGARISKSVIVSMCVNNMLNAGKFQIGDMSKMTDLFAAYLNANIGEPGEGCWMEQSKGRNAQVWETRQSAHIV